jgi:hypothetical protein
MSESSHNSFELQESPDASSSPFVLKSSGAGELLPTPELLRSLGRLARGLSILFWGIPIALVVCVQTAKGDWFRPLGALPPVAATAFLFYGLSFLGQFQKQERPWRTALDRTRFVALINLGLSPFLYWWNRIPANPFFGAVIDVAMLSGLLFLFLLNPLILRLAMMLPDETLRQEAKLFADLNRYLLFGILLLLAASLVVVRIDPTLPSKTLGWLMQVLPVARPIYGFVQAMDRVGLWLLLFFVLLPLAMTMALIWKTKEIILASVFGPER